MLLMMFCIMQQKGLCAIGFIKSSLQSHSVKSIFPRYSIRGSKFLSVSRFFFQILLNSSVSFNGREAALKSLF